MSGKRGEKSGVGIKLQYNFRFVVFQHIAQNRVMASGHSSQSKSETYKTCFFKHDFYILGF